MKKNTITLLVVLFLVAVAVVGAFTFSGELFQGRLELNQPALTDISDPVVKQPVFDSLIHPDLTIDIYDFAPLAMPKNLGAYTKQDFEVVVSYEVPGKRPYQRSYTIPGGTHIPGAIGLDEEPWNTPGVLITATIDPENVIPESNEDNNTAVYTN